jgi:hypothetical protein
MFNDSHDGIWDGDKYDSREKAITAGLEEFKSGVDEYDYEIDCFYVGEVMDPGLAPTDFGVLIGDELEECHSELGGEFFDGFSFKYEHVKELNDSVRGVVETWMKEYKYTPGYSLIRNTERIDLRGEGQNE